MNEEHEFLAAIAAAPEDEAPKKVYADWLDDHGESEKADRYRSWKTDRQIPPQLVGDCSWEYAFEYAGEKAEFSEANADIRPAAPHIQVSTAPFERRDIIEIIGIREGANDGPNWVCVGQLFDGRWFALDAGCDYTGWG